MSCPFGARRVHMVLCATTTGRALDGCTRTKGACCCSRHSPKRPPRTGGLPAQRLVSASATTTEGTLKARRCASRWDACWPSNLGSSCAAWAADGGGPLGRKESFAFRRGWTRTPSCAWHSHPAPWELEDELIQTLSLPLNLQGNQHHPFHRTLSVVRAAAKQRADELPILG